MLAIVGLGNPGKEYENTVHNIGYMAIDHFAKSAGLTFSKSKFFGRVAEGFVAGEKVILLKPETYMNLSGKAVDEMRRLLKLDTDKILVICDDIDLPFGDIRVRTKGSAGTHNGMRNIVSKIGEEFPRFRLGVGKPDNMDLITYVLSKFSKEKLEELNVVFDKVDRMINDYIKNKSVLGIDINNY